MAITSGFTFCRLIENRKCSWYAYQREMAISLKKVYIWDCMVEYNTVYLRIVFCFVHFPEFVLSITDPSVSLSFAVCSWTAPREASRLLCLTFLCGTWPASLSLWGRSSLYIGLVTRSTRRGPVVWTHIHVDVWIVGHRLTIFFLFKRAFRGGSLQFRKFARDFRWGRVRFCLLALGCWLWAIYSFSLAGGGLIGRFVWRLLHLDYLWLRSHPVLG